MRYVNPLVEGSSPSPVTETEIAEISQKTLRNEGFSMRCRSDLPLLSSRTETNENDAERPPVTTKITTRANFDDPDLAFVADNWTDLPAAIRAGILAIVRSALEREGRAE
jgi:hypothetical protein